MFTPQAKLILPRQHGFRFPAQWTPHLGTLAAWPVERGETWMLPIDGVRAEYAPFIEAIAADERVFLLLADPEARASFQAHLGAHPNITPLDIPLDDCWLRDSGPVFVTRDGEVLPISWRFNAWGGKFSSTNDGTLAVAAISALGAPILTAGPLVLEGGSIECNGAGVALTTRSCIMSKDRNPDKTEAEISEIICEYFGLDRLVILDTGFASGDHTDGHIDMVARFTPTGSVLVNATSDETHPSAEAFHRNSRSIEREGFSTIPLPVPRHPITGPNWGGGTVTAPANYANFYATTKSVLVPQFGDPHDAQALRIISECFPNHQIKGLPARSLLVGGGGIFNCLTQQIPAGNFFSP